MATYKTLITIENPEQVVLSNLPFQKGQRVRVVILTEDGGATEISQRLRDLFRATRALPGVGDLTDTEIVQEIQTYRQGLRC